MPRIMFVPNSLNQLKKFQAITAKLPHNYTYLMVNLDKFKKSYTLETMIKEKIPFVILERMNGEEIDNILNKHNSDILVVGNDTEVLSLLFIKGAKRKDIPVLLIQDGTLSFTRTQMPLNLESMIDVCRTYGIIFLTKRLISKTFSRHKIHASQYGWYSDYIAVWGKFTKKSLMERGIEGEKIVITGSTSVDLLKQKKFKKDRFLLERRMDPAKKTVFFAASDMIGARLWTRKEFYEAIKAICEAIKHIENVQLIIKLHPFHFGREPNYLREFVDNKNIFSGNDTDTLDLLFAADVLITDVSTTALEALAIGKPVAVLNLTGKPIVSKPYPGVYIQKKAALLITEKDDARKKIEMLLFDEKLRGELLFNSRQFIKDQLLNIDGKAAARIAQLIKKIIKDRGDGHGTRK